MFTNRAFKNLNKFLHSKNVTEVHFRLPWKAGILIKFLVKQLQYFTDLHRTPYNLTLFMLRQFSQIIYTRLLCTKKSNLKWKEFFISIYSN